jgi:hypothetical protein
MATDILIQVNSESFQKRLNITGEIWLDLDGFSFPSKSWSDFPVIILSWWVDALALLRSEDRGEFLFMDGPHHFEVMRNADRYLLRCFNHSHDTEECVWSNSINRDELFSSVLSSATTVVRECRERGWVTADTVALESKLNAVDSQSA